MSPSGSNEQAYLSPCDATIQPYQKCYAYNDGAHKGKWDARMTSPNIRFALCHRTTSAYIPGVHANIIWYYHDAIFCFKGY